MQAKPTGFQVSVKGKDYALAETGTKGGPVTTTRNAAAAGSGFKAPVQATTALPGKPGGGMGGGL